MTTLVALITSDFLVLGTDSLGTYSKPTIELDALLASLTPSGRIKFPSGFPYVHLPSDGDRIRAFLKNELGRAQPYANSTQADKLYHISAGGQHFGVMTAGRSSLGDRSIGSLIQDFEDNHLSKMDLGSLSLDEIGGQMHKFMRGYYESGTSELLLCGFDSANEWHPNSGTVWPKVVRISVHNEPLTVDSSSSDRLLNEDLETYIQPDVVTGGVNGAIERLVQGIESPVASELALHFEEVLQELHEEVDDFVEQVRRPRTLRRFQSDYFDEDPYITFREEIDLQKSSLPIDYSGMNIQTGIDFVDFLVNLQIKADEFSINPPTVGGKVQIALMERSGFTWISKAATEWTHEGHSIKRPDRN